MTAIVGKIVLMNVMSMFYISFVLDLAIIDIGIMLDSFNRFSIMFIFDKAFKKFGLINFMTLFGISSVVESLIGIMCIIAAILLNIFTKKKYIETNN